MSSNPKTEQSKTMDVQTAQRVEQERMTRRAALRKMGFGAGLAAFSLLGVDDLARMVGQRMERMAGDNKVARALANEFQQAGIAVADPPNTPPLSGPCGGTSTPTQGRGACCTPDAVGKYCGDYHNDVDCNNCITGVYGPNGYCSGYNQPDGSQTHNATLYCPATPSA